MQTHVSYMEQKNGSCFCIYSVNLHLFIGELHPLILIYINDQWLLIPIIFFLTVSGGGGNGGGGVCGGGEKRKSSLHRGGHFGVREKQGSRETPHESTRMNNHS